MRTFNEQMQWLRKVVSFDTASLFFLLITVFVLPLFFSTTLLFNFQFSKTLLIVSGILISFILFIIAVLKRGSVSFAKHPFFIAVAFVPLLCLVSSLVTNSFSNDTLRYSLIGHSFESGTTAFIISMFVMMILVSLLLRSKQRVFYTYLAFIGSFFVIALFHLLEVVFTPSLLSTNFFFTTINNILGKWNDIAVFFGVTTLLSLISLEMLRLSRLFRGFLYAIFSISLVFLIIINFKTVWIALGVFSLILFLYIFAYGLPSAATRAEIGESEAVFSSRISAHALIVLILSVLFVLGGTIIGGYVSSLLHVSNVEVRPSWSSSYTLTKTALIEHPFFGVGPNNFSNQWLLHKPSQINSTQFWNINFNYAIGYIPTFALTTGALGFLSWIVFLLYFLYLGSTSIFKRTDDLLLRYLTFSSFTISSFLWTMAFFYVPGAIIITLAFFFTGVFLSCLYMNGYFSKVVTYSFFKNPRLSFLSMALFIVLIIAMIGYGFVLVKNSIGGYYYQQASAAYAAGKTDESEAYMVDAINTNSQDTYYRALSQIDLAKLSIIINTDTKNSTSTTQALQSEFQAVFSNAIDSARKAVASDPTNYANWISVGDVYASVVPLKIDQAYENAKLAYQEAQKHNPQNPGIILTLAQLDVAHNDLDAAKDNITQALKLKPNYADAIFLLSQIEASEGDLDKAIASTQSVAALSPNSPGIFFQLGLLEYNNKGYADSVSYFGRAVTLAPSYANAKYFLGLSFEKVGQHTDAIKQFQDLVKSNPDNKEVALILSNLQAGVDPFAGAELPITNEPESRDSLPLNEDDQATSTPSVE